MDWRASTVDAPRGDLRAGDVFQDNFRLHEARNFLSEPPAMEISHSVATGQAPLPEAATAQELRNPHMEFIPIQSRMTQLHVGIFTLPDSQNLPVTEHGGLRDIRVQGYGEQELHSEIPEADNTSTMQEYEQSAGTSFLGTARQGEVLTYPEGEAGAVTISERDMEGLKPTEYLGNNIIDFYIRYLERTLSLEERGRCHFFNSFFFTKLLGSNSASYNIDECKVDYEHVRKWTREVNPSSKDEKKGSPCILHLDPAAGVHGSFKRLVRSYISKAWMEKYAAPCNMVEYSDQLSDLFQMEYIQAEAISLSFSPAPRKGVPLFSSPHFAQDISVKRVAIRNLILKLKDAQSNTVPLLDAQRHVSKNLSIGGPAVLNNHEHRRTETGETGNQTSCELSLNTKALNGVTAGHQEYLPIVKVPMHKNQQVRKRPGAALPEPSKVSKKRKWTDEETQTLLKCKADSGDHFRMKNQTGMNWDNVSLEISKTTLGITPSAEQCRRRYETLQKSYKSMKDYCAKTGRAFAEITEEERVGLKLATTLSKAWYKCIDAFSHKGKSLTRARHSGDDGIGQISAGDVNYLALVGSAVPAPSARTAPISPPAPIWTGNSSRKHFAISGFKTLEEDLRSTLLDLMMFLRIGEWTLEDFEETCRWVGTVQDRKPSDIRRHLSTLKLVNFEHDDETSGLNVEDLRVYEKFVKEVLRRNPDFDIDMTIQLNRDIVSIPKAPVSLSVQRIRVLVLMECGNLQSVDLSFFPQLRYLDISDCRKLEKVTGWESVKELGYLEIKYCGSYKDFPPVQWLPSLREFRVDGSGIEISSVPDFSQCVRLRRVQIRSNISLTLSSMDLSTLRFLKVLDLSYCDDALTTIQGLSGLHSLTTLDLSGCKALRRVPELGCLKALTQLDVGLSGVEEIPGVQELHLLTSLYLCGCCSLKTLPWLGHLKALTELDIRGSDVEEILGVHDLISLEKLRCDGSKLKWLPDLHHLPRLKKVWIWDTPLSRTVSPSSVYYGKAWVDYESLRTWKNFDDDISDISDTDCSDINF